MSLQPLKDNNVLIMRNKIEETEEIKSPGSDQCCSSCWHCCISKNSSNKIEMNHNELNRSHNMSVSVLYLLCIITGASSLAVSFWLNFIDVYWLHVSVIALISPALIAYILMLACKTDLSEGSYNQSMSPTYKRSYIIALIPCTIASIFLDAMRLVLYIKVDKSVTDLLFINFKLFYMAFQVLFLWKYLGTHLKENLLSRMLLMHLIGTNVFLWFHEFSLHSSHSLEFLPHDHSKKYDEKARLTIKIIEKSEPYIYPLIIQFMIIASGASYQIWLNMRSLSFETQDIYIDDDYGDIRPNSRQTQIKTYRFVSGTATQFEWPRTDVATTKRSGPHFFCGLVFGIIVFVGLVFSSLVLLSNRVEKDFALKIYYSYEIALFASMSIASWLSLREVSQDEILWSRLGGIDILVMISMLGYLLYAEFSFIAGLTEMFSELFGSLIFCTSVLRIIQVLLQTTAITKAFRNTQNLSNGGCCSCQLSSLMFLLFTNAGLWITESIFDLRIPFVAPIQRHYYGVGLWRAIKFALFPLCVLYRFISCSCLLEILLWSDEE